MNHDVERVPACSHFLCPSTRKECFVRLLELNLEPVFLGQRDFLIIGLRLCPLQDSNNDSLDRMVKSYSNMFDLCGPIKGCAVSAGRHLFMEGDLKLKDSQGKVSAVSSRKG